MKPKTQHLPAPIEEKRDAIDEKEAEKRLTREEWDFSKVPDEFLGDCWRWEWPRSRPDIVKAVLAARTHPLDPVKISHSLPKPTNASASRTVPFNDPGGSLVHLYKSDWPTKTWLAANVVDGQLLLSNRMPIPNPVHGPMQVRVFASVAFESDTVTRQKATDAFNTSSLLIAVTGWPLDRNAILAEIRRLLPKEVGNSTPKGDNSVLTLRALLRDLGMWRLKSVGFSIEEVLSLPTFNHLVHKDAKGGKLVQTALESMSRRMRRLESKLSLPRGGSLQRHQ